MSPILTTFRRNAVACTDRLSFYIRPRYRLEVPRHMCVNRSRVLHAREDVAEWCDAMMPGRWRVIFTANERGAEFHFVHQGDLVMFKLMWSEDIADNRLRVPDDIWPAWVRR